MTKRKTEPVEPKDKPGLSAAEVDVEMQRRKLDAEVGLANARGDAPKIGDKPFRYGPTEPPGGVDPNKGAVPPEVAKAMKRALPVEDLQVSLGVCFKSKDETVLYYLDQTHPGEFVLRPYWKKV